MKVIIKGARGAFLNLFELKSFGDSQEARCGGSFILDPKAQKAEVDKVMAAITEVAKEKWGAKASDESVRKTFADMGLKPEQYLNFKTISPAAVDKMVRRSKRSENKPLSVDQWERLQPLIAERQQGGPKVVPDSDPRSALVINPADDFDTI